LSVLIIIVSSCQSRPVETAIPESAGYLISGLNENLNFAKNGIAIFSTSEFSELKKMSLPNSRIEVAEISPDGKLWLGLSGGTTWDDDRVVVLDATGNQIAEINVCLYPTTGIWFYKDKAYVVCRDTGFISTVAEVDFSTFIVERRLEIGINVDQSFMAVSSGLSGSYLAVNGLTTGSQESLSYSVLSIVNLDTFTISGMIELGAGTNIWSILPYNGKLYLLNVQGKDDPKRKDIFVVNPKDNTVVESITLRTPSPLWGVISNNVLYSFHNGGWNSIFTTPERFLCSTDLITYQQDCLALSDGFEAFDIEVVGENPCVTHWGDDQPSGLYCLENGELELKLGYEDASLIILKK
jgi:hypothetical protein